MTYRNEILNVTTVALAGATTDKAFEWNGNDDRLILVVENSGTTDGSITIKAGDGIQGVNDLTLTVKAGTNLVKLDSGRFKNVTGTNKGKILVSGATTIKVAVVELA